MRILARHGAVVSPQSLRSVYSVMSHQSLREQKTTLRRVIRERLAQLSEADIASQSAAITKQVLSLQAYQDAKAISVFLSMPGKEASTNDIVLDALRNGKIVFVPYIFPDVNQSSKSMEMLQITDESDLKSLKPDPWGIPSLSPDSIGIRQNACGGRGIGDGAEKDHPNNPQLDLILLPAVGFDRAHNRLGHGKGFYDRYLDKFSAIAHVTGSRMPLLVGLGLREQLLPSNETVPHGGGDRTVDLIVTPDSAV